jgi:hypothetical protein
MGGPSDTHGMMRNVYKIVVVKLEGKNHMGDLSVDVNVY